LLMTSCENCGGKLVPHRISLQESILLCKAEKCLFPLDADNLEAFVRPATDKTKGKVGLMNKSSADQLSPTPPSISPNKG